jgi:serine/threonine-protein kinase
MATTAAERLTVSGMTVGTAAYMSPEQVLATTELDQRSDIYSLGCVLYECLAGEPLYAGLNDSLVMQRQVAGTPPDLAAARPDVPQPLARAVQRALAKRPGERWQSAAEMLEALDG